MTPRDLVVGIDAGGTATRGVLVDRNGAVLRRAVAGGANLRLVGGEGAAKNIGVILRELLGDRVVAVCIGAAGIGREVDRDALIAYVGPFVPKNTKLLLRHDAQIALRAAAAGRPAMVVIAGTGSFAYGERGDGSNVRAGGYGAVIGDEGGAFAIGLAALRHTARVLDGVDERSALADAIITALGAQSVADLIGHAGMWPPNISAISELASAVGSAIEAGDSAAHAIALMHGTHLGEYAACVAGALHSPGEQALPVALAGGAFDAVPLLERVVKNALEQTGHCEVRRLDRAPALGAAQIALERIHHP